MSNLGILDDTLIVDGSGMSESRFTITERSTSEIEYIRSLLAFQVSRRVLFQPHQLPTANSILATHLTANPRRDNLKLLELAKAIPSPQFNIV